MSQERLSHQKTASHVVLVLGIFLCLNGFLSVSVQADTGVQSRYLQQCGLGTVKTVAYSPDGQKFATGGGGGVVLFDAQTGELVRTLQSPGHSVTSLAFTSDSRTLLTGGMDHRAILWDLETGSEILRVNPNYNWACDIESIAIAGSGSVFATSTNFVTSGVKVWDCQTGQLIREFDATGRIAFSPNGKQIFTDVLGAAPRLWDIATGAPVRDFGTVNHLFIGLSSDGSKVLTRCDDLLYAWDTASGGFIALLIRA